MPARARAYIFILIAIIIWAIAGPVIKYSLNYLDTITFLTIRFGLTSLILVPFWLWTERHKKHLFPKLKINDWILLIVSGLMATTIQLTLLFLALKGLQQSRARLFLLLPLYLLLWLDITFSKITLPSASR